MNQLGDRMQRPMRLRLVGISRSTAVARDRARDGRRKRTVSELMRLVSTGVVMLVVLLALPLPAWSQAEDSQNVFDWYYSAVFGTGVYRVGGRDVAMFRIPYEREIWTERESPNSFHLSVPVTLGVYAFDAEDIPDLRLDDVATVTVFPGLAYRIPVGDRWRVTPFINVGYGKEFNTGEEATIYSTGVRTRGDFRYGRWRWLLGNALYYAGNTRDAIPDLGFAGFEMALDVSHATSWRFRDNRLYTGAYVAFYGYSDLEFVLPEADKVEVANQYEVGFTFQTPQPVEMMGFEFDRVGIGYLTSDDFDAIRLVLSFPY